MSKTRRTYAVECFDSQSDRSERIKVRAINPDDAENLASQKTRSKYDTWEAYAVWNNVVHKWQSLNGEINILIPKIRNKPRRSITQILGITLTSLKKNRRKGSGDSRFGYTQRA